MAGRISYYGGIVMDGLVLNLDASKVDSYPRTGTLWRDLSFNENNGSLINFNSPSPQTIWNGDNGGSIVFDGISDYVTLGNDKLKYQTDFTVESFARFTNTPNNAGGGCGARHPIIYNHDYGYSLYVGGTGQLLFTVYNTINTNVGLTSPSSVVGQNYFHAVGIKSGTTISLYLNGVLISSGNLTSNQVYYIAEPFVVGGFARCGTGRFYATGNISVVRVYNKPLSSSEVLQNYNSIKSRFNI